jgi:hypothetical protein
MGYTHYWENDGKINRAAWNQRFAEAVGLVTQHGADYGIEDLDLDGEIFFNGDCETFAVPADPDSVDSFNFCKTQYGRYDDLIIACLCLLAEAGLSVSSDGDKYDWADGVKLASEFVGHEVKIPVK